MYDFTVYSFFALLIGKLFFPSDSAYGSLLLAVATFGIGFVMRPLGGVIIGNYADRKGRKAAMTLTIGLLSNVFTAYFVSRTLFELTLSRNPKAATLSI